MIKKLKHWLVGLLAGREVTCTNRINYGSQYNATGWAFHISNRHKVRVTAYPCVWCRGWHLRGKSGYGIEHQY